MEKSGKTPFKKIQIVEEEDDEEEIK